MEAIEALTQQMQKLSLNYANLSSALLAQTQPIQPQPVRRIQPARYTQPNNLTQKKDITLEIVCQKEMQEDLKEEMLIIWKHMKKLMILMIIIMKMNIIKIITMTIMRKLKPMSLLVLDLNQPLTIGQNLNNQEL
ncbi:hypothetical protein RhiirA5_360988 [Rhizophagus irregularis]|uniref:Uncharacterized protein n=1 Tax=Rhizophagus irregularis TaxID=588596 RepID=A0A2N0PG05_9GLOM|nr:hypothetical protein RhiirA5_360988 [Rhizophagus irregularis]